MLAAMGSIKEWAPLAWRKSAKVARAALFERLGSDRYSWPALNGLDRRVAPRLPNVGVFLEVGANDGYSQSNTYHLERIRGWAGILIEPHPSLYERCRKLRRRSHCVNAACVGKRQSGGVIDMAEDDLMSFVPSAIRRGGDLELSDCRLISVPARTLTEIVETSPYDHIDFMSVDVEGAELALLEGFELSRFAPTWMLIETDSIDEVQAAVVPYMRLTEQLTPRDYLFQAQRGSDSDGSSRVRAAAT